MKSTCAKLTGDRIATGTSIDSLRRSVMTALGSNCSMGSANIICSQPRRMCARSRPGCATTSRHARRRSVAGGDRTVASALSVSTRGGHPRLRVVGRRRPSTARSAWAVLITVPTARGRFPLGGWAASTSTHAIAERPAAAHHARGEARWTHSELLRGSAGRCPPREAAGPRTTTSSEVLGAVRHRRGRRRFLVLRLLGHHRLFFSFISTSVAAPTRITATPPTSLASRSWSFSRS